MEADGDFIGSKKANSGRALASVNERSEGSSLPAICPPIPRRKPEWQPQDAFYRPISSQAGSRHPGNVGLFCGHAP